MIDLNPREPLVWAFGRGAARESVAVQGRLRFSRAEGCFAAAACLRDGGLQRILADAEPDPLPITALQPPERHVPARMRRCEEFLVENLAG